MNTPRKGLRAWVRYDGTDTPVAGSLLFQKDKPKSGKWKEYYPCTAGQTTTINPNRPGGINLGQFLVNMNSSYQQVTSNLPAITYFTDAGGSTYINNGCGDMYDNGNVLNTNLTQTYNAAQQGNVDLGSSIPYTHTQDDGTADPCNYTTPPMDGQIVSGAGYFAPTGTTYSSYFTNMYPGMFMLAATQINIAQFGTFGDLGSDGASITSAYSTLSTYPNWTVFLKTNDDDSGTGDPNVIHIILLQGQLNNIAHAFDATGQWDDDGLVGLDSDNVSIIYTSFARQPGTGIIDINTAKTIADSILDVYNNLLPLVITFDNIANVPVLDPYNVSQWNTFFDLPTNGSPFQRVGVQGNVVKLYSEPNIVLKQSLFENSTSIVSIEDDFGIVTSIDEFCFRYCTSLQEISFSNVTVAYQDCFTGCTALTTVSMPLLQTGVDCFAFCTALTTISLPSLQTDLGTMFAQCTALTTVNLPQLTSAYQTFTGCSALVSISLPSLTTTGSGTFGACLSLVSVSLPNLQNVALDCFNGCFSLSSISLPSATVIGSGAFVGCTSLTTISLPICTNLGATVGDDLVFNGIINQTITLTVPNALLTCNSGNPDGDIEYLTNPTQGNTVTVVPV